MRKRCLIVLILMISILAFCLFMSQASGETDEDDIDEQLEEELNNNIDSSLDSLDLSEIEDFYNEQGNIGIFTEDKDLKTLISDFASGKMFVDYDNIFEFIVDSVFSGIKNTLPIIVQIMIISILFAILSGFSPAFGKEGVSGIAYWAEYLLICGICLGAFISMFNQGITIIDGLSSFSTNFFPVMYLLLTMIGGISTTNLLKPATTIITGGISAFIKTFILPLLLIMCVMIIISTFSKTVKLNSFTGVAKSIIKWSLGIVFIIFIGFISLQGLIGGTFDGVSIKAAKYTIDKVVPVIGGMLSDTVDMMVVSSALIKNALGVAGIIMILGITFIPAVNLLAQYFVFRIAAAVIKPISDNSVSELLHGMSEAFMYLLAVVATVGVIFIASISMVMSAGNMNLMLR
ncbi:MAG: stage III sporulation protein AE [Eubacteriales bacterium]